MQYMTQILTVFVGSIAAFILVLSPFVGFAVQRQLTVDSLEAGYAARIAVLESEIASTTKALDGMRAETYAVKVQREYSLKWSALNGQLTRLNEDRRTTDAAYQLLVTSLR